MDEKELLSETRISQLLEEEGQQIPDSLDLWPAIARQLQPEQTGFSAIAEQRVAPEPSRTTRSRRQSVNWPKLTRIGLGLTAVLALIIIAVSVIFISGPGNQPNFTAALPATPTPTPTPAQSVNVMPQAVLSGHNLAVRALAWSPDGKILASNSEEVGGVKLWNSDGTLRASINDRNPIYSLAWSPDGKLLTSPYNELWDQDGKPLSQIMSNFIGWSPDGKLQIFHGDNVKQPNPELQIKRPDGTLVATLSVPVGFFAVVKWSPDGKNIVAGGQNVSQGGPSNIRVWIWDLDGTLRTTITDFYYPISTISWSPDGKILAIGAKGQGGLYRPDGSQLLDLSSKEYVTWSFAWSPDGKFLAGGCSDKQLRIWNREGKLLTTLSGHSDEIWTVAWSPDGKTLASGSGDKTIRLWKIS